MHFRDALTFYTLTLLHTVLFNIVTDNVTLMAVLSSLTMGIAFILGGP